jgi:hypothetical protein
LRRHKSGIGGHGYVATAANVVRVLRSPTENISWEDQIAKLLADPRTGAAGVRKSGFELD